MEQAWLFVSILCLVPWLVVKNLIKQLKLLAFVSILGVALWWVVKVVIKEGFSSYPFLLALITGLLVIIGLLVILGLLMLSISLLAFQLKKELKHDLVRQLGSRTIGKIISAKTGSAHYSDGDPCVYGVYTFRDSHGQEHRFEFSVAIHYPNFEQWHEFQREYSVGTEHTVYYLPWLPSMHEIEL